MTKQPDTITFPRIAQLPPGYGPSIHYGPQEDREHIFLTSSGSWVTSKCPDDHPRLHAYKTERSTSAKVVNPVGTAVQGVRRLSERIAAQGVQRLSELIAELEAAEKKKKKRNKPFVGKSREHQIDLVNNIRGFKQAASAGPFAVAKNDIKPSEVGCHVVRWSKRIEGPPPAGIPNRFVLVSFSSLLTSETEWHPAHGMSERTLAIATFHRIQMDVQIPWEGGERCPVPDGWVGKFQTAARLKDPRFEEEEVPLSQYRWSHVRGGSDIVKFIITNDGSN